MLSQKMPYQQTISSISAGATDTFRKTVDLVRTRSLSASIKAKFHASATGNVDLEMYYSPDGQNYDTEAFATLTLTCSAGATCQVSGIYCVPEHGTVVLKAKNNDATYAATEISLWTTIQDWTTDLTRNTLRAINVGGQR